MLRLADAWTWDFWLADDGRSYHLYFLKAPRHIGHPDQRHWNVSIGHATSPDLADWTGSVVRGRDGTWFMFYTGVGSQELTPGSASAWPPLPISTTGASTPAHPSWKTIPAGTNNSRTRFGSTRRGATRGCSLTPGGTAGTCS